MYDIMIYIAQTCKMEREKERVGGGYGIKKTENRKRTQNYLLFPSLLLLFETSFLWFFIINQRSFMFYIFTRIQAKKRKARSIKKKSLAVRYVCKKKLNLCFKRVRRKKNFAVEAF